MFVLIHIMLKEDYDVFKVAVAVELKIARPMAYPLTQTLRVAYENNQVYVYFIPKLLRVIDSYFILTIKN